jgi:monoamine oxidase
VRVVVVGAGFAGLAAASDLVRGGRDVTVLEARERVGGRVWSVPFAGTVVERGAEFVLDGYDSMRRRVDELGLELSSTGMSYQVREPRGVDGVTTADLAAAGPLVAAAAASAPFGSSVVQALSTTALPAGVRDAVRVRIEVSGALAAERLDASALVDAVAGFEPGDSYRVRGGNQQVATGLAAQVVAAGGRLRLGIPVVALAWDEAGAVVRTDDEDLAADAVVVTVPFPVLHGIAFEPVLPAWKLDAVAALGVGEAAKLHVALSAPVRPFAVTSVPDRFWSWAASDGTGAEPSVLASFSGSAPALQGLAVDDGPQRWRERLVAVVPEVPVDPGAPPLLSTWVDDPWARCAYSATLAGRLPDTAALAAPVGPLHFAGEHTAGDLAGLMEGALRSGERAAAEVAAAQPIR